MTMNKELSKEVQEIKTRWYKDPTMLGVSFHTAINKATADIYKLISTIESQAKELESTKVQLQAKLVFINNGWEEERYALQEEVIDLRNQLREAVEALRKLIGISREINEQSICMKHKFKDVIDEADQTLSHIQGKDGSQ